MSEKYPDLRLAGLEIECHPGPFPNTVWMHLSEEGEEVAVWLTPNDAKTLAHRILQAAYEVEERNSQE